jgi:hypothetical protein
MLHIDLLSQQGNFPDRGGEKKAGRCPLFTALVFLFLILSAGHENSDETAEGDNDGKH